MKKLILICPLVAIVILIACKVPAKKEEGIVFFEGSWSEVLQKAKAEHKPIFVDVYASWCGPCKMLKKQTFADKEVGAYFNANFINTSFDGEKGDGVMLANQFQVQGYPTLVILDPDGNVINGSIGFLDPDELLQFARQTAVKGKRH